MEFESLVLLVGTNPLPNFITSEYFIEKNQKLNKIWLVYSETIRSQEGTRDLADNIVALVKKRHPKMDDSFFELVSLSDVGNARSITREISNKIVNLIGHPTSLHLNYTGGTKAMGLHVYQTLSKADNRNILEKSFSYLDSRSFRIVDDDGIVFPDMPMDLRDIISLPCSDLITLHGFFRTNENKPGASGFSKAQDKFRSMIVQGSISGYFQENGYRRSLFLKKNSKFECLATRISHLKNELREFTFQPGPLKDLMLELPEGCRFCDEQGQFKEPSSDQECKKTIQFLDGSWLENYAYETLKSSNAFSNVLIERDWVIKKNGWATGFQIDVLLIVGYQFVGISCTTAEKKDICKSKGFEILHRARQIGGDEARAVLVTRADRGTRDILQEELSNETGSSQRNILVLGVDDWKPDIFSKRILALIE